MTKESPADRLTLYFGSELVAKIKQRVADVGSERGEPVTVSEWVRGLIERELAS